MAGRFRHTVTAECFYGDVYRTPDKHNMVVTAHPFTKNPEDEELMQLPSYLQPMDYDFDEDGNPNVDDAAIEDDGEVDATDGAITLAEEFGIDLETVEGSGKQGRITKDDVQAAIDQAE